MNRGADQTGVEEEAVCNVAGQWPVVMEVEVETVGMVGWGGRLQVHLSQQSVLLNWSSMLESCACNRGGKLLAEWQQNIRQLTNHQEMYPDRMIRLTNGSYQIFGIGRKTSEFSHKLSFSTNRTIKIKKLVSTFKIFETIPNFE